MSDKLKKLIDLVPRFEEVTEYGTWRGEAGGFPFVSYAPLVYELTDAVSDIGIDCPEYGLCHYQAILEANGMKWSSESIQKADETKLGTQAILAMLLGLVRGERFCDGVLLECCKDGTIIRLLRRLRELNLPSA